MSGLVYAAPPVFLPNSLGADVSIIDAETHKVLRRIPIGKEPHYLYLTPNEKPLLVANAMGNSITLVDPTTSEIQYMLTGIVDPYQLKFSPDMRWFVTAANRLDHITIDSQSTVACVSLQDSNQLISIDLHRQEQRWTISVGEAPADVFLTPDDKTLLVALTGDGY